MLLWRTLYHDESLERGPDPHTIMNTKPVKMRKGTLEN